MIIKDSSDQILLKYSPDCRSNPLYRTLIQLDQINFSVWMSAIHIRAECQRPPLPLLFSLLPFLFFSWRRTELEYKLLLPGPIWMKITDYLTNYDNWRGAIRIGSVRHRPPGGKWQCISPCVWPHFQLPSVRAGQGSVQGRSKTNFHRNVDKSRMAQCPQCLLENNSNSVVIWG